MFHRLMLHDYCFTGGDFMGNVSRGMFHSKCFMRPIYFENTI